MPRPLTPLPPELGEFFTTGEARSLGISQSRLGAEDLTAPFRGVRERFDAERDAQETSRWEAWRRRQVRAMLAYTRIMPEHQFFSGYSAAALWRLPIPGLVLDGAGKPLFGYPGENIEVAVCAPHRSPERAGVIGRQVRPRFVQLGTWAGAGVLTPLALWVQLGPRLSFEDRVALGDAIIRAPRHAGNLRPPHRPAYATLDEVNAASRISHLPGGRLLREAVPHLRQGSASAPESHLRLVLSDTDLPTPELDYDVYDGNGRFLGCSELAFPEFRLAIEYEGDHHRTDGDQWNRDIDKGQDYKEADWDIVRVTATLLYRERVRMVARIRKALMKNGWRP